jgi:autotransporter passenger strand-loop-strand repeat protein
MATSVTVNSGNSPYTISPAGPIPTTSSSVSMFVLSGGVADFTTLSSGGFLTVNFGGVNSITTVISLLSPRSVPNTVSAPPAASDEWHGLATSGQLSWRFSNHSYGCLEHRLK